MEKKIFSVFFLAILIFSVILLTIIKVSVGNTDFGTVFESPLPIIVFYYVAISVFWVITMGKMKKAASSKNIG